MITIKLPEIYAQSMVDNELYQSDLLCFVLKSKSFYVELLKLLLHGASWYVREEILWMQQLGGEINWEQEDCPKFALPIDYVMQKTKLNDIELLLKNVENIFQITLEVDSKKLDCFGSIRVLQSFGNCNDFLTYRFTDKIFQNHFYLFGESSNYQKLISFNIQ
jgi:hypothetical protein